MAKFDRFKHVAAACVLLAGVCAWSPASAARQAAPAAPDLRAGAFSRAQVTRGEAAYTANCGSCHKDDLTGNDQAPALVGDGFMGTWSGQHVADLLDRVQKTMPLDRPGSLSRAVNLDITIFLLEANGFRTGAADLPDSDALKTLRIDK
jgi:cytochrome c